jgi:hypothetical protein
MGMIWLVSALHKLALEIHAHALPSFEKYIES